MFFRQAFIHVASGRVTNRWSCTAEWKHIRDVLASAPTSSRVTQLFQFKLFNNLPLGVMKLRYIPKVTLGLVVVRGRRGRGGDVNSGGKLLTITCSAIQGHAHADKKRAVFSGEGRSHLLRGRRGPKTLQIARGATHGARAAPLCSGRARARALALGGRCPALRVQRRGAGARPRGAAAARSAGHAGRAASGPGRLGAGGARHPSPPAPYPRRVAPLASPGPWRGQ